MFAFLLILLAIVSRVAPHPAWLNFTAVGGGLLYFGARRPLVQAVLPAAGGVNEGLEAVPPVRTTGPRSVAPGVVGVQDTALPLQT